ncbi:MAG: 50S ribosomal protein L13 [Patescibacteria group bacterium]
MKKVIERKYHSFNAKGESIGRLSTEIARVLRGKNKVDFDPSVDGGDFAVVINCEKIKPSGNKLKDKAYFRFSGYPGGITKTTLEEQIKKDPTKVIRDAVYGMLPKNKLRDRMMTRLLIYVGDKHDHKIDGKVIVE